MTTAVSTMPVAPDFGTGPRELSPPKGSKPESDKGSPTPRTSRVVVAGNVEKGISPLPNLRSSDKDIDKTKPLPTSLISEFIPDDILCALTALPAPADKKIAPGKPRPGVAHTKLPKGGTTTTTANLWNFPGRRKRFQHLTDNPKSLTGAGKDISFLYDVALADHPQDKIDETDPSSVRVLAKQNDKEEQSIGVPETLVPSEYHVVRSKGVQYLEYHDDKYTTQLVDPEKRLVSFPSLKPASRYEVLQLQETMDTMLKMAGVEDEDVEVKGPTQLHNLLELIKKEQNIYNIVFHELIRQVSVECTERGQLLANLRGHYSQLLDKVPRQMKSLHEEVMAQRALDRRLTEELFRFKTSIAELTNELSDVREHDKVVTTQAQQAQEELSSAMADSEKNSSLLTEYHELYELQRRRLETQVMNLSVERELWSAAAYNLALKVTEANALSTAKRLHISEKSWSKLANHFTIVLSDRDTEQLSQLQSLVESHRDMTMKFNEQLRKDDTTSQERLLTINKGIEKWLQDFLGTIIANEQVHNVLKAPDIDMVRRMYKDLREWEELLNKEVEKFGGDILLGYEEQMYRVKKLVDKWTEIAVQVFNRHKSEDGSEYPDRETMIEMNKRIGSGFAEGVSCYHASSGGGIGGHLLRSKELTKDCDMLMGQFHTRINGENGTARGCIHIANTMESWDTKLSSILNGGAMPLEAEWSRLYELFEDWLHLIEGIVQNIGSSKKNNEKTRGKPHNPLHMVDVFRSTQKWLTSTTNSIDSQDSKLVEQVSVLHTDMVHWMIQVLLRLAPDRADSPPEAIESAIANAPTVLDIQEKASALFDRITTFSNYITSCCSVIVAEEVQKQQDHGVEDADHEYRDLKKVKSECAEWIHTAILLIEELRTMPGYEGPPMTPMKADQEITGSEALTPAITTGIDEPIQDDQLIETPQETPELVESDMSISVPEVPPKESEAVSNPNMSEMQVIGHDDNVRTQSLEEETKPPAMAPCSTISFQGIPASTRPSTPDTNRAYEALAAVKTLQVQLIQTEERAQAAENRVNDLEEELKVINERMRCMERKSATPIPTERLKEEEQEPVEEEPAGAVAEDVKETKEKVTKPSTLKKVPKPSTSQLPEGKSTPTPPHSPSPTMGRKTPLQGRPLSQSSIRSGASSRASHRSKKGK